MSDTWRRRRAVAGLLALSGLTTGLAVPATPATAARHAPQAGLASRGGLTISPSSPAPGDTLHVTGRAPTVHHKKRRVTLAVDTDGGYIPVARATTAANGSFDLQTMAPTTPGQMRLQVTAAQTWVRKHGHRVKLKTWTSRGAVRVKDTSGGDTPPPPACPTVSVSVSAIAPTSGPTSGGIEVTLTGTALGKVRSVAFGDVTTTELTHVDDAHLSVVTPANFAGPVAVRLTDCAAAQTQAPDPFTYNVPPDESQASSDTAPTTYTARPADVVLIEGGGLEGGDASLPADWWVTLAAPATPPHVGDPFYLEPDVATYAPAGVAGRTAEVVQNADGTRAVRVTHASLNQVFDSVDVAFSGPLGVLDDTASSGASSGARTLAKAGTDVGSSASAASSETGVNFGLIGPNALGCKNKDGQKASFDGSFGIRLENIHGTFDLVMGSLVQSPSLRTSVTFDTVISGKVSVEGEITCKLLQSFVKAHTKIVPLGSTGATFSFGPSFEFKISGAGTWQVEKRYRRTLGLHTSGTRIYRDTASRDFDPESSASANLTASIEGGALLQIGFLDSVGLDERLLLGAEAKATASTNGGVCVSLTFYIRLKTQLFLELWGVFRIEDTLADERIDLKSFGPACLGAGSLPTPAPSGPVITTTYPPSPLVGKATSYRLRTADNRTGSWRVTAIPPRISALPPGLLLSGDTISGTPTTAGKYLFRVTFTDATGHTDTADLTMVVRSRATGPIFRVTPGQFTPYSFACCELGNAQITADARYVLYPAMFTNPALFGENLWVLDRTTGAKVLATRQLDGMPLDDYGADADLRQYTAITPDGRYVIYASYEDDVVTGDKPLTRDVFRFDTQTGTTRLVSRAAAGIPEDGDSFVVDMDLSGTWLMIGTVIPPSSWDATYYNIRTDSLTTVEPTSAVFQNRVSATDGCTRVAAGGDGWVSAPDDTNGFIDVLIRRGGPYCDGGPGSWRVISRSPEGDQANGPIASMGTDTSATISPNGRYVVWSTCATNMVDADETECADSGQDVIRRDLVTGKNVLISRNMDGEPGNGSSWYGDVADDGTVVFISGATDLDDDGTSAGGVFIYRAGG